MELEKNTEAIVLPTMGLASLTAVLASSLPGMAE